MDAQASLKSPQCSKGKWRLCSVFPRAHAGDHIWLLEDGVAWEHGKHHHGDQPCGSGKGKPAHALQMAFGPLLGQWSRDMNHALEVLHILQKKTYPPQLLQLLTTVGYTFSVSTVWMALVCWNSNRQGMHSGFKSCRYLVILSTQYLEALMLVVACQNPVGATIDMTTFCTSGELVGTTVCIAGIHLWIRNLACYHASVCLGVVTYQVRAVIHPKVLLLLSLVTVYEFSFCLTGKLMSGGNLSNGMLSDYLWSTNFKWAKIKGTTAL